MAEKEAGLDLGKVTLWKDVEPEEMWRMFKADLHRKIDAIFRADRPRAVAMIKDRPDAPTM